jgi:hypothetical protein
MMISLIPHGIMHGRFTEAINQLQKTRYAKSHESYLNAAMRWLQHPPRWHRKYQLHSVHSMILGDILELIYK